ncbi:hypothetical protein AM493_00220 [Flavobacterium akiainvivens]|uniref:Erythromycin esterase n=1 Tax=Flavobacterium akiainvivens TaxID=1202724 RepID=A0A0M9VGM8_9FLAO|nr:hypothetical protein [Flavobacterium akiainvivens]KOS04639.1 hypothetical protein AM493_00220 [Flavobacterium akiainvivens]SFQ65598.1 hypothetical protein SAMN05444144_11280 [Flavobacterium akiainvivens]
MKKATILFLLHAVLVFAQDKEKYLSQHKNVLDASYTLPEPKARIIGFGAYHGSAKTEDAEVFILQSLLKQQGVDYYFAETDISIAHYFNLYLSTGDEALLKDLIIHYGTRVPQERTVNVLEKWKRIKALNDKLPKNKKITVLGPDIIVSYKYTYRHLLSLIKNTKNWPLAQELQKTVDVDTTDYSAKYDSFSAKQLKDFVADYEADPAKYNKLIKDKKMFAYIISNIKTRQQKEFNREKELYENYLKLRDMYSIKGKTQFFRLGFFHIMKHKEGNNASFFSILIDNGIYKKQEVVTVMGYFTKSEVIWDDIFDDNGKYLRSTTEGDFGIGDAPNEYFKGIEALKKELVDDCTIYRLNAPGSPYNTAKCTDMIEVVYDPPQKADYGTACTADFIDYAVLIGNSPASISVYTIMQP